MDASTVQAWVPQRQPAAHKGTFGHVLVVAGSPAMPGAATLCLQGALRSGAGRVSWAADEATILRAPMRPAEVLLQQRPAAPSPTALATWLEQLAAGANALVVGPGLGTDDHAKALVAGALRALRPGGPALCLDADALTLLAHNPHLRTHGSCPWVLTPHPKEMARLTGQDVSTLLADPAAAASRLAHDWQACCLLKGSPTYVAGPNGELFAVGGVGDVGGPALAHAGTGDVLCGLVGGLLAQGVAPVQAAAAGAWVHAAAGDAAAKRHGNAGTLASDVALAIGDVWRQLER